MFEISRDTINTDKLETKKVLTNVAEKGTQKGTHTGTKQNDQNAGPNRAKYVGGAGNTI